LFQQNERPKYRIRQLKNVELYRGDLQSKMCSMPNRRRTNAVQILFLEFDGVMHPEFCHDSEHFMHRDGFEAVMRVAPWVELVISSTWRYKRSLAELKALLADDVAARIIGATPRYTQLEDVPETLVGYEREAECRNWLNRPVF
jgi:hypothetical protein